MSPSKGILVVFFTCVLYSTSSVAQDSSNLTLSNAVNTSNPSNWTPSTDGNSSVSCTSSTSTVTSTVVITETTSVWNSTTGAYEEVTTTRNSTVTRQVESSSSNCNESTSESFEDTSGWRSYVYFRESMMTWSFKQWMMYLRSVSHREWDFAAFASHAESNGTVIPCNGASKTTLQICNIMNVFEILKDIEEDDDREESCRWFKQSMYLSHNHRSSCMQKEEDESDQGMDSSDSDVMARRLGASHMAEMAGFGETLCTLPLKGNMTVWTSQRSNKTCNLWSIRNIIVASMHIRMGWKNKDSCREATVALRYLKNQLKPCNGRLRFLLATLIRQAEMRQKMLCTPPTCNIPYASTCALDAEMRVRMFMEAHEHGRGMNNSEGQEKNSKDFSARNGTGVPMRDGVRKFCRDMKVAMACVANHTISCDVDKYNGVNKRMMHVGEQFRTICSDFVTMPPKKCMPPPAIPVDKYDSEHKGHGDGQHMGSMHMSPRMKVLKRMSMYSIFDDHFLCQAILTMPEISKNKEITNHFCGMKDVEDDGLSCLSGTGQQGGRGTVELMRCNKTLGESMCMWQLDDTTNEEFASCATPTECSESVGPQTRRHCCNSNLCNYRGSRGSCQCDVDAAYGILKKITSQPDTSENSCDDTIQMFLKQIEGCPDYTINVIANSSVISMMTKRCPNFHKGFVFFARKCGNACYGAEAIKICTGFNVHPCGDSFTECLAALTSGCSKRQMLRAQHSRMRLAQGCSVQDRMSILKNAASSSRQLIRSEYEASDAVSGCFYAWIAQSSHTGWLHSMTHSSNMSWTQDMAHLSNMSRDAVLAHLSNMSRDDVLAHLSNMSRDDVLAHLSNMSRDDVLAHLSNMSRDDVLAHLSNMSRDDVLAHLSNMSRDDILAHLSSLSLDDILAHLSNMSRDDILAHLSNMGWVHDMAQTSTNWVGSVMGLGKCLESSNATYSPDNMIARKFHAMVSTMTREIAKLKSDGKFDEQCFADAQIDMRTLIGVHFQSVDAESTEQMCLDHMQAVSASNCSDEMKRMVLSALTPDCVATWVQQNTCPMPLLGNCFLTFLKSSGKSREGLFECLNSALESCEPQVAETVLHMAYDLAEEHSNMPQPGDKDVQDGSGDGRPDGKGYDDNEPMSLPYDRETVEKYYGGNTCVCDPALAVHCIFDVHHLSRQDDPDWENLCPLVSKSAECAHRYVQGCGECQQKTVREIVRKLNYRLNKTCKAPPESKCKSIKAMDCVTNLMEFYQGYMNSDNIATCVQISKTRKCVEANLKDCEATTELKVNRLLNQAIERWEGLECESPDEQLGTCRDLFQSNVDRILSFDVNAMFSNLQTNNTEQWEDFQRTCDEMGMSWQCVEDTLDFSKGKRGSKIIQDSLRAVYMSMKRICTRTTAPLQCYACYGEGSRSCSRGTTVDQCNPGSICQTVTDQSTVKSRGCTPSPSCKPGCVNDRCTYCCSDSLCNDLDNGPITGSCNRQAISGCMFDLSREFTENEEFTCSSVEIALDCLDHERMQCEMGGVSFSLEEISSSSLRAEAQVCLLREAEQTCTIQPVTTTASFISACGMHIDRNSLCSIVADNRRALRAAESVCTEEQTRLVRRNVGSFETSLGFLDCSDPYGFVLGRECKISDAMKCFRSIPMGRDVTVSCDEMTQVAICIQEHLTECQGNLYTWPIRMRFGQILRQRVSETCDAKIVDDDDDDEERDPAEVDIEKCLDGFTRKLETSSALKSIQEAVEELETCLFDFDSELILTLTSVQRLYLETVSNFIEIFVESYDMTIGDVPDTVSSQCSIALDYLARQHFLDALVLPSTVTNAVPAVCSSLETSVEMVIKGSCSVEVKNGNAYVESSLSRIDMIRERLIVNFCPEVTPIPRCLVIRAEQCLTRFSAYVGPGSNGTELCSEARALVQCTKNFAATCTDGNSVVQLRSQAYFAMEAISQNCYKYPELVAEARCTLLRQVDAEPGCNRTALSECAVPTGNNTCMEVEEKAACFVNGAGQCLDTVQNQQPADYQSFTSQLARCRSPTWSDGTPRDSASLLRPCGQSPGKCDPGAAVRCLSVLANYIDQNGANITEGVEVAKACLERNYYCFNSVITLMSTDIRQYSSLLVHVLRVTPAWTQIESTVLIRLLNLPSFVLNALQQTPDVSLNLWDICWNLDRALSFLLDTEEDFPGMDLPSFQDSTENLRFAIQNLCNGFGAVAELLQFPQLENPTCAAPAIKANINILLTRTIAEFYTNQQARGQSVCSSFMSLNASLSASLQASPLSLDDCSDGLRAQAVFSMRAAHLMIRSRCEMAQSGGRPRCSLSAVGQCVRRLYNKLMLLGITETEPKICNELQQAEACVKRFSFQCDSSRMGRVGWMWRSVSRAAARSCVDERRVSICESQIDPDHAPCDVRKARRCSLKQYRDAINPFVSNDKKCRSFRKNMECIQTNTRNCNATRLPKMFMMDPDEVENIQERLGCDPDDVDETFGCRKGCMIDSARACLTTFQSRMTRNMWGLLNSKTCGLINEMRFCVEKHTSTCRLKERRGVFRARDKFSERFPQHHEACVDVATCAADFDSLVRQIEGLRQDDDFDYEDDESDDDDECEYDETDDDDSDDEDTRSRTSDKDKTKNTDDKDRTKKTSDGDKTKKTSDKDKTKKTSDKDKTKKTSDEDKTKKTHDTDKSSKSSDKSKRRKSCGKKTKSKSSDSDTKGKTSDNDTKGKTKDNDTKGKTKDNDTKGKTKDKDTKSKTNDKDTKSKDTKSKDSKSKDTKSKDSKSKDTKSKDTKSKDTKSKDTKSRTYDKDTKSKDTKSRTYDKDTKSKDTKSRTYDKDTKSRTYDNDRSGKRSDKDDDGDRHHGREDREPAGPSLQALCNRIRQVWTTCLEPGLKMLPQRRSKTVVAMYRSIWAAVEERCKDTTQLRCYTCKHENDIEECERRIETCPHNKQACLLRQTLVRDEIRYTAGCANPNSCYNNGNGNSQTSCCYGELCNTASDINTTPITQEPESCKIESALMCALDFTMSSISTDEIDCRRSTRRLSCVQRYAQTCTSASSKSLVEATNRIYLELASSSCVVEAEPGDCFSLAIFSMQAILSNAYVSEGNAPCVGLQETEASVRQTIEGGTCSEAGRIGLESSLAFIRSIVGPHCEADSCQVVSWSDVIKGDGGCSGQIFSGIKFIYRGYSELNKADSDCGLLTSYVEEARGLLGNCKMVAFLRTKLEELESKTTQKCGQASSSSLPPVCVGTCQTDVVIQYVRNIRAMFDSSSDKSATCMNLMQVERVYGVYTTDCTSVQQKDVVKFAMLTLSSEIESCRRSESSFTFQLTLKRDVYYQAVECQNDFQREIAESFEEGSQERLCKAVADLEECQYELPSVFEDFIMGPTNDLLTLIDNAGLCDGNGADQNTTTAPRQPRATCEIGLLSALIQQLLIPPNIATSSFESRDLFCQDTVASFEQAKNIQGACGNSLNAFQQSMFSIMVTTVEKNNKELCPPLRFEEEGCNLSLVGSCFSDLFTVLRYANIATESVCRQARFSLECLDRFTISCKAADEAKATAIRKGAVRMVKDVVVNNCPGLVEYLYCDGDLSTVSEGCHVEKAEQCAAEAQPDLSQRFTEGYCDAMQEKVDCTKRNLIGCEDEQVKSVSLPGAQLNSICGINNTDLNSICRSESECPRDEIQKCFENLDKCENQQSTLSCLTLLMDRHPRCSQTIGSSIEQGHQLQFYSADLRRCGSSPSFPQSPVPSALCLPTAAAASFSFLQNAAGTPDEVLFWTVESVTRCLSSKDVTENFDVLALQQTLTSFTDTLDSGVLQSSIPSDIIPQADNGKCSYSKAAACLGRKIQSLMYIRLLNTNEREHFCQSYSEGKATECFEKQVESCPNDKKTWFSNVNNRINKAIDDLGVCQPPQTCIVSEGFACINKFGTVISQFDRSQDKVALCTGRAEAESCIQSFTFTCSSGESNTVMEAYNELAAQVNLVKLCEDVELPPPPICPELPERSRVCYLGNAFTCLFRFGINILQGDSLIWRQQCMTIQRMMTCVARSTSGCSETDEDVKSIRRLLKEFVMSAGDHCPWLSENLCTEEAPCPVTTAGCEVVLEQGLLNRQTDVCTLERFATECVTNNTATCTKAQRNQAMNVMKRKLRATGLPGTLMCDGGNIEGHLYSFLSASGDVAVSSRKTAACLDYDSLYDRVNTEFSNPESKEFMTLAKSLIDQLHKERTVECNGGVSDQCAVEFPVKRFGTLISDLMGKDELHLTSFCAQAQALLIMNETSSCNSAMFDLIQSPYSSKCLDEVMPCDEAEAAVASCIASYGDMANMSCSDQQRAAVCVSTHLPSACAYKTEWFDTTSLCSDVVVLQATHSGRSKQFVCEAGLEGTFGWKRVAGADNFTVTIDTIAADIDSVPRCLKGPKENDPIPQVFYNGPRSRQAVQDEVMFKVYGREDYKQDGPQVVNVGFTVEVGSESFQLPPTMVHVNDRNIPNSVCSSINDPHVDTHDNIKYDNMEVGWFILWRHTLYAEAVVVQYSQCSKYGSCNCGAKIYAGKSSVTFDLCDQNTDIVSYSAENGARALNQQRLAVLMGKDLKTYSVILLDSRTIVKVRIEGVYMNVWVIPSAKDIGATQGLCGVFDGDGYNDFQLPDFTQYEVKESDGQYGDLAPTEFNNQWKITRAQADDYTQVFVPSVTISTDPMPTYCYSWVKEAGEDVVTKCDKWANMAICGLVNGDDQTASLLENFIQDQSSQAARRKKREAPIPIEEDETLVVQQNATWPTESGWTLEAATAWCLDKIPDDTLQKCTQAVASLDGSIENFELDGAVQDCIGDIKASGGTEWLEAARIAAYEHCIAELNQNPGYQNNAQSSYLAIQFLDATCSPPDCNSHGTCSLGTCNCDSGYYGTSCDITQEELTPPVLKAPEDNVLMCEIDSNSDCSSVFISGSNFVSSSQISCHYQEVEITETEVKVVPGSEIQIVQAQLIARDRVRCDLGERSTWKRSLHISVSNDGVTPHSQYQLFMAYDPVCFACDLTTCTRQTNVCVIGNTCVMQGASSVYDDCHYCDLSNPTQWTIRNELDHCKEKYGESSDSDELLIPLVGAGCALLALLVLAVIGLIVFLKRREDRRRRERLARIGQGNPTYEEDLSPFDGSPVLMVNVRDDPCGKKLGPDHYHQDA